MVGVGVGVGPLCGYARGYFTDKQEGDKRVGFIFRESSADETAVFYNQQLMTLVGDALRTVYGEDVLRGIQARVTYCSVIMSPSSLMKVFFDL